MIYLKNSLALKPNQAANLPNCLKIYAGSGAKKCRSAFLDVLFLVLNQVIH